MRTLIKEHQLIIAAIIVTIGLLYNGHQQSFQLIQLSGGRFFQVNKNTGEIIKVCQLDPAHCYKWDGLILEKKEDYMDEYLKQKRKVIQK